MELWLAYLNMRKKAGVAEYNFLVALWCESEFNKCFTGIPSVHAVVFQPTGLTTGIYWPPLTTKAFIFLHF